MNRIILFFLLLALFSCGNHTSDIVEGPVVKARKGVVVSAHPESSRIGTSILIMGGNAVDAAVATELALAVCYPEAGNLGGGGFMVIRLADGSVETLDYREKCPGNGSRNMFLDDDGNVIEGLSTDTHLASGIPGTVDGILTAHEKYGKMPFRDVIQPAIDLAEKGFRLSASQAYSLNSARQAFMERNNSWPAFVKDSLWKEGDVLRQPELAETLKRIRDDGREGFYGGRTAEMIINEMKRGNGIITEQDLRDFRAVWRSPLKGYYRDYTVFSVPPPSSGGIILLQLLGMIEDYPLSEFGFHSRQAVHLMVEAERRAFADRAEFLGDPGFVSIPVNELVSKSYLKERMRSFNTLKASLSSEVSHGEPYGPEPEETTHYSVVDGSGNAVAATTTLNGTFGNAIVVDGAGFLLNNQMDDFSVKPGFPNMYGLVGGEANSIQPLKKMLSSMTPVIIEKDGRLFMVLGSPGGSTIPTSVFQVIVNVIDFGMDIGEAVGSYRFHHQWLPDNVVIERNGLDSLTLRQLEIMGHDFSIRNSLGRVNAIFIGPDGILTGAADSRGNNVATGF